MAADDIQRIFEKLDTVSQRLASIEANQQAAKEAALDTAKKLDDIRTGGCVTGKDHDRRITNLESRPERSVGVVASIVAIAAAIVAWIKGTI